MQVKIKEFTVEMQVKNKGVEFDVADNDGKHLGDLIVTKTGLIWCRGRTTPENGQRISWSDFMNLADATAKKAA